MFINIFDKITLNNKLHYLTINTLLQTIFSVWWTTKWRGEIPYICVEGVTRQI